jgi:UDP-N-acetylglucosamine pyrophosphorylase
MSKFDELWPSYEAKMKAGGNESESDAAINAFKYNLNVLASGASTMLPESGLDPVASLPEYDKLGDDVQPELLKQTVVLKLNGGLGTGMGLDKAKSLLPITGGKTFLDLIAKQVEFMKVKYSMPDMKFMLMNSFSTSKDTLEALAKYTSLGTGSDLEFVQNKAPKVTAADLTPALWPENPEHEWCPPGHGDLYPAMLGSGTLDKLLGQGMKYMFVSNSDNLGATMDLKLLTYFAKSGAPFMMEVAARTDADKKGGHLATMKSGGGLTLRESAQCPKEDEGAFQDVTRYTYFNTNNLWVDLEKLKGAFEKHGGALPLPVMVNDKTVDPRDKKSTKVIQLETAMGAAISCFEGATAILIPRSRFAPVKKCDDLIALRSDAYVLTEDFRIELAPSRAGKPPTIKLDDMYKFVDAMDTLIPNGVPSLIECSSLKIEGPVEFAADVKIVGDVKIVNKSTDKKTVAAGTYENSTVEL